MAREPADVTALRGALGQKLAAFRELSRLTQRELGKKTYSDRSRISHIERGAANAGEEFWKIADDECQANGELLAAYYALQALKLQHEEAERAEKVATALAQVEHLRESSTLIVNSTASERSISSSGLGDYRHDIDLGESPESFLANTTVETPVPTEIGWTDVKRVRATTQAIALSENLFGGGVKCESALAELRWARRHLDARASNDVRRAMHESVGNLASVVAYSAFDIANYEAADRCFRFALWCATEGDSWALRANTLAEMARKAEYMGDVDSALTHIEFAQVRQDRLSSTARAMLWTLHARLLALTEKHTEAIDDVTRADENFAASDPENDPPWLCYYDLAEHQGSTGKALIPVAMATSRLEVAVPRLESAVAGQREDYPRSRAFSRTRLASLTMAIGDPREAVTIGREAYNEALPMQSTRIVKELKGLAATARQHARIGDVSELAHDIDKLPIPGAESSDN